MGFTYNDTASADMGLKARLTSWQVCGGLRNYTASIPGKSGVADFGADFDYREIKVSCSIAPKRNFTSLVSSLDDIALWLDPTDGLKQLVFDDVPDRYFMARLYEKVDCERLLVRSEETVILLNLGGTSAGLDIHLYPKQYMEGGSVTLAQGVGGQKATFPNAMNAGDDVALLASTRECTRNGVKETKYGFYQYSAAWDSKHIVSLPQGKSAQLLYSMQEMDNGGGLL